VEGGRPTPRGGERGGGGGGGGSRSIECMNAGRRIHRGGFIELIREVISALGYLPLWGTSKFYLRVRSLPGVNPKPPFSPILDSTDG